MVTKVVGIKTNKTTTVQVEEIMVAATGTTGVTEVEVVDTSPITTTMTNRLTMEEVCTG